MAQGGPFRLPETEVMLSYLQEVLLYWDPEDANCRVAREFLAQHGIAAIERDVRQDPALQTDLHDMGSHALPTIVVNGVALSGYDPKLLAEVLGL